MKENPLRGKLLEFLKTMYPDGADKRIIVSTFFEYHKVEDIIISLQYLADKEYILKKEVPHPYNKAETVCWFKILPKGIDLLDGNIPADPGILILRG